ncbi:uncharacterized protein LOC132547694 [Ylistrum balloti]|uniref:uncharacterized protein LOC132547694 n=1 Tax=Ylistrum balloti TaxID=509963 RepID=UPI0029058F68|nr:uncharacterized protein LOC132547694 [Ylistrum balloti]
MFTLVEGLKFGAATAMGLFSGGALYINGVEHYSRRPLPVKAQREQWANSFNIAKKFLPSIGLIGFGCSTALFFLDDSEYKYHWLVGPVQFVLGGVYTVVMMLPEINILLDEGVVEKKGETWVRGAIDRWNYRHMFRTFIDSATYFLFVYLAMKS